MKKFKNYNFVFQLLLVLIIYSCGTTNSIPYEDNESTEIFDSLWSGRDTNNCILGRYVAETPPITYSLTITDSMLFLKTSNRFFKDHYDTMKVDVTCNQKSVFIENEIKIRDQSITKEMNSYSILKLDTGYYSSSFLLFKIDTNYILFYQWKDHQGNDIELPQFDRNLYFSWLLVSGIERRIIEHYFGYPYSELTKFSIKVYE